MKKEKDKLRSEFKCDPCEVCVVVKRCCVLLLSLWLFMLSLEG